jgi:hypothetical protein
MAIEKYVPEWPPWVFTQALRLILSARKMAASACSKSMAGQSVWTRQYQIISLSQGFKFYLPVYAGFFGKKKLGQSNFRPSIMWFGHDAKSSHYCRCFLLLLLSGEKVLAPMAASSAKRCASSLFCGMLWLLRRFSLSNRQQGADQDREDPELRSPRVFFLFKLPAVCHFAILFAEPNL